MVEVIKIGNKTLVMDGKILSLFWRGQLLRRMVYMGYGLFDNSNDGEWVVYIKIPITTIPTEDAQYRVVIDPTYVSVYNVEGTLKTQSDIALEFWKYVRSDGKDIRVFNQNREQLYFWIEKFDYTNKRCVIWVLLPKDSSELNIAIGNPVASESSYNNGDEVFEFFDDFLGTALDTNKWVQTYGTSDMVKVSNSELTLITDGNTNAIIATRTTHGLTNFILYAKVKFPDNPSSDRGGVVYRDTQSGAPNNYSVDVFSKETEPDVRWNTYTGSWGSEESFYSPLEVDTYYIWSIVKQGSDFQAKAHDIEYNVLGESSVRTVGDYLGYIWLIMSELSPANHRFVVDWIFMVKLADPAEFGTPQVSTF